MRKKENVELRRKGEKETKEESKNSVFKEENKKYKKIIMKERNEN